MKLSRKIISAVSAAAVFVSMAIPAFANNSYTTTVTYDIRNGKANFVTSGTASFGKEVTHIVYEKTQSQVIDNTTIYYVDQTTADSKNGSFSFSYSVNKDKAAKTAVSVVGTDGAPIAGGSTEVPGYTTITVTNGTGKDVTFTPNYTGAAPKTIGANEESGVVYVKPGDNVTVSVAGVTKFKYSIDSGNELTTETNSATVTFAAGNSSIAISNVSETTEHNWANWGTNETDAPAYDVIITTEPVSPSITNLTFGENENPTTTGGTALDKNNYKKSVTYTANISKGTYDSIPDTYSKEYGIIFADKDITGDFNATTEYVWILPALTVNSNGEWAICVMDSNEDGAALNDCRARTYVKIGSNYAYGEIVSLEAQIEKSGEAVENSVMSPAPVAENIEAESVEPEPADEQTTETDAAAEPEEPGLDKTVNADGENTGSESILDTTDVEEKAGGETDTQTDNATSTETETPDTEPNAE